MITRHNTFYFDVLIPRVGYSGPFWDHRFKDHRLRACAGVDDAPAADDPPITVPAGPPEPAPIALERPILGPSSSVANLKQRLKELGQPIYGEKAILWRGSPTPSVASPPA